MHFDRETPGTSSGVQSVHMARITVMCFKRLLDSEKIVCSRVGSVMAVDLFAKIVQGSSISCTR